MALFGPVTACVAAPNPGDASSRRCLAMSISHGARGGHSGRRAAPYKGKGTTQGQAQGVSGRRLDARSNHMA